MVPAIVTDAWWSCDMPLLAAALSMACEPLLGNCPPPVLPSVLPPVLPPATAFFLPGKNNIGQSTNVSTTNNHHQPSPIITNIHQPPPPTTNNTNTTTTFTHLRLRSIPPSHFWHGCRGWGWESLGRTLPTARL